MWLYSILKTELDLFLAIFEKIAQLFEIKADFRMCKPKHFNDNLTACYVGKPPSYNALFICVKNHLKF